MAVLTGFLALTGNAFSGYTFTEFEIGQTLAALFPPEKEGQPALLRFEQETRPEAVQTDTFNAASPNVPHLGPAPELLTAVFATQGPSVLDQVYPVGDGFVVAQVTERQLPDDAKFEGIKQYPELIAKLKEMGHSISSARQGDAHSIGIDPRTGVRVGAADRRLDGKALGQ